MQLLIRIIIRNRTNDNIENDKRLLKYNYRSKRNYSTESALLEKRLICNISKFISLPIMHLLLDLELCYDR